MKSDFMQAMVERSFLHSATDIRALDELMAERSVTGYIGFDLTADCLHVGSLIQIMVLRWMARTGHRPIVLLGECTTLIGDPSGKTSTRPILDRETIERNRQGIEAILQRLVPEAEFVSNLAWMPDLMTYLRDFGSHFAVNRMITQDSVKSRLEAQETMSFLEFNYMLFQAIDFFHLHKRGCVLQIGGSDQWGNIVQGLDLIRRKNTADGIEFSPAFGLTTPLLTTPSGEKMGKTAGGAVWLDPLKTSPFDFWQFWRNIDDSQVDWFTGLFDEGPVKGPVGSIIDRKVRLATAATRLVHGNPAAERAALSASGASPEGLPQQTFSEHDTIADVFVRAGLVSSKGEADRLAQQGGLKIDGRVIHDARQMIAPLGHDVVGSVGKKKRVRLVLA